jgi:hypothetical protein
MPDTKITALTALTTADPATDMFPIVDVSDTTMAASGTTKRISINNILACSPAATLASATITGDLTVDTNVLKVDTTNNRVGVNNASPSEAFDVSGNGFFRGDVSLFNSAGGAVVSKSLIFGSAANTSAASIYGLTASATAGQLYFATETGGVMTDRLQISDTGVFSWLNVGGVAGTAMTLNSTGLGIGASPTDRLTVWGGSTTNGDARFNVGLNDNTSAALGTGAGLYLAGYTNGTAGAAIFASIKGIKENGTAGNTAGALVFTTLPNGGTNVERMRIDSVGNVSIGDTAFAGTRLTLRESASQPNALAMTNRNATQTWRLSVDVSAVDDKILGFYDSTSTAFRVQLYDTGHFVTTVPTTPPTLGLNSTAVWNLTSNTNLRVSVRGTDGVTRVANITLA